MAEPIKATPEATPGDKLPLAHVLANACLGWCDGRLQQGYGWP